MIVRPDTPPGVRVTERAGSTWTPIRPLVAGEEVRFTETGPWCEVLYVSPCAAAVRGLTLDGGPPPEPEVVDIPERERAVRVPERRVGGKVVPAHTEIRVSAPRTFIRSASQKVEHVAVCSRVVERRPGAGA